MTELGAVERSKSAGSHIEWFNGRELPEMACPLCGAVSSPTVVVTTPDTRTGALVDFVRCVGCESVWPVGVQPADYPNDRSLWEDPIARLMIHHALELVSGLDRQVRLVDPLRRDAGTRFLEIGCNVGVLSAYVDQTWASEVEAIEPSVWGEMAKAAFGLTVHDEPLTDRLVTEHEHFDVIVAIEVIEHVDRPDLFLAEINRRLAPGGSALITTPAAESLDGHLDEGVALAALSVGSHRFLYSAREFEAELRAAGFASVAVERVGHDLVAYVGRLPTATISKAEAARRVLRFRDERLRVDTAPPRAELGLMIDHYLAKRTARPESGVEIEAEIEASLRDLMGIDIFDLEPVVRSVLAADGVLSYGQAVPFRFGDFLYWRGQREDLSEYDRTTLWEAAVVVIDWGLRADPQNLGPLLPSLGPPVLAVSGRLPGAFRGQLRDAVSSSPNEVLRQLEEPPWWVTVPAAVRRVVRSFRGATRVRGTKRRRAR